MANSVTKFLKQAGGRLAEVFAVVSSAGAADADKIPALNGSGVLDPTLLNAKASSAGAGDANKVVMLGADGKIDSTMFNASGNSNSKDMTTSEALSAGNWVNIHDVSGSARVRKADAASPGKPVMGYVLAAAASGATVKVYFEGENTGVSGMTAGDVYLSATTPGAGQAESPTGVGVLSQFIGVATSATSVNYQPGPVVVQAG
jgi:hypothetical protein